MNTTKSAKRSTKIYRIQHPVEIHFGIEENKLGEFSFTMMHIVSADPTEEALLSEDGEFGCWDSVVTFKADHIEIDGSDGPSGGTHSRIILIVPQNKIHSIETESM